MGLFDKLRGNGEELPYDANYGVGPYMNIGDHEPVTLFNYDDELAFVVCLDCGFLTDGATKLKTVECDRENNPIVETWRERLDGEFVK